MAHEVNMAHVIQLRESLADLRDAAGRMIWYLEESTSEDRLVDTWEKYHEHSGELRSAVDDVGKWEEQMRNWFDARLDSRDAVERLLKGIE